MTITNPSMVSDRILLDVVGRLADPVIGFNPQLAATIAAYPRYTANAPWLTNTPLVFPDDYTGNSPNVTLCPLAIDEWMGSSPTPKARNLLMQIYVISAVNYQKTKGLLFDGIVNVGIDCHVLWGNSKVLYDMDAPVSAVENTIFTIFNTVGGTATIPYQSWSSGVIYNGKLSVPARTGVKATGTGFMQLTTMTIQFGYQAK